MPFISLTRLRLRSLRFVPAFALHAWRSRQQVRSSPGYQRGETLMDRQWTFWTMTAWDSHEQMRHYMTTGDHKTAMPKLMHWCDEASVAHWDQPDAALPSWADADRRMRSTGRPSKVLHPSPNHAALQYREPRLTARGPIPPAPPR